METSYRNIELFNLPSHKSHNEMVLKEVITNDCYSIKKLINEDKKYDILIDIGSNIGTVTTLFLTNNIATTAYCVESDNNFLNVHKEFNKLNGLEERCNIDNVFIGLDTMNYVSNIIENNKDKTIFLKMDVEGYEYYLLKDLFNKDLFKYVTDLVMEIHTNLQLPDIDTLLYEYKWRTPYNMKENIEYNKLMLQNLENKISMSMNKKIFRGVCEIGETQNYILLTVNTYI
jgi:hypothetical protein